MTRLLITGLTGFIGRRLLTLLLDERPEIKIIGLVRETYAGGRPLPPPLATRRDRFELVYADLRNFNLTVRALREAAPDQIIHLAAAGASDPFLDPHTAVRHNVDGTINLLRAAFEKIGSTGRLVVARTPGELINLNTYAASKRAAWDFCRMYVRTRGWPIVGGMIYQCYGPGQAAASLVPAAARAALTGQDFPMTAGTQARDWIYVDDVARGLAALATAENLASGETIPLGTGRATSVAAVVDLVYALTGSTGRPRPGALPSRPGEAPSQAADLTAIPDQLNWRATTSLQTGLTHTIEWVATTLKKQKERQADS